MHSNRKKSARGRARKATKAFYDAWSRSIRESMHEGTDRMPSVAELATPLAQGADPNKPLPGLEGSDIMLMYRDKGVTACFASAQGGNTDVLELLLTHSANPNVALMGGQTPIFAAATFGHVRAIELLLVHGADPSLATKSGYTPLFAAAKRGHTHATFVLLTKGNADPFRSTKDGTNPLHIAARLNHLDVVALLTSGPAALLDKGTREGATACYMASQFGHVAVVRVLLEAGADPDKARRNGSTPCCVATWQGHIAVVELLLSHNADPNKAMEDGNAPCGVAARNGHVEIVKLLLARGADVNHAAVDGTTACFSAVGHGHAACVEELLSGGADPNASPRGGPTPLWVAAIEGHVELARLLVAHGAHAHPELSPETPPALATYLEGAREWTSLHRAADSRDVGMMRRLLRDPRVDPRMATSTLSDMRTALAIAESDAYPTAIPADPETRAAMRAMLKKAELIAWTPATHRLCSADVQQAARARTLMMDACNMDDTIDIGPVNVGVGKAIFVPRDVWDLIFSFLVDGLGPRYSEVDEAAFAAAAAAVMTAR